MNNLRGFKQKLSIVTRLWENQDYDRALAQVESLLEAWPGNAHLHVLWAGLVQLTDDPKHELKAARQALQQAVELDKDSPAAAIELGHFLDNVDDDPQAATKAYAEGVGAARKLLIEGLIGQARAYRQLDKREDFRRCLLEVLHLNRFEPGSKRTRADDAGADIIFESPTGHFHSVQVKGPYAEEIESLLSELTADRPA
jgi:lipopolysaccharide biosynthesis regulator YciM